MRKSLLPAALVIWFAGSAAAEEASQHSELNETMLALQSSETKRQTLLDASRKVEAELADLQKETVGMADTLKDKEKALDTLEDKLSLLEKDYASAQQDYAKRERQLAAVLQGMVRIGRTPEGAVIAMPGEYETTLKTAKMLGITGEALQQEADRLKSQLAETERLKAELETTRTTLAAERSDAENSQNALKKRLAERKKMQESIYFEQRRESKRIAELSAKSKNLRDLMTSLEEARKPVYNRKKPKENKEYELASLPELSDASATTSLRSFLQAKGKIKTPVSGKLAHRFGDKKGAGEAYKGIVIASRSGAQVTSPFDGEVVFTGPFLDYGKLIIIRHSDNFHTLLAGVEEIQCAPGQFLLEGEPIGAMNGAASDATNLYMELRQNGKPVDPAPWVAAGL